VRGDAEHGHAGQGGSTAVPGEDNVLVLPVHGAVHGPSTVSDHARGDEVGRGRNRSAGHRVLVERVRRGDGLEH